MLILVTGGSGSGKSAYAEQRVCEYANTPKYYIATMQVYGEEGEKKVARHKALRAGKGFLSIEKQTDVSNALDSFADAGASTVLLECMSNLVANEMFTPEGIQPEEAVIEKVFSDVLGLISRTKNQVIVTNKVFEDGIEYGDGTMAYMRALGRINALIAEQSDEVWELVVGIPIRIK